MNVMKKFILLIVFGISLNLYGQEDMLSQEQLKVFSKENPIPPDALEGNEAVIKYLKME